MNGSVYKRGKTYTAAFSYGSDDCGKRKRITKSGFKTMKDAKKYLASLNGKYFDGELLGNENILLTDFLDYWFNNYVIKNLADNTVSGYRTNIYKHIIPDIGNLRIADITPLVIQCFYTRLSEKGLSPTSITYIHRNLHTAFKYAEKMEIFRSNVFDKVKPPKIRRGPTPTLTAKQVNELLAAAENTDILIPVALGVLLGLRRGEALGVRWCDFDYNNRTLKIEHSATRLKGGMQLAPLKTNSSYRSLLLPDFLAEKLQCEKEKQAEIKQSNPAFNPNGLICCRENGTWITTNYLNKHFKHLLQSADLPLVRFHDLRHTNATLLIEGGASINAVSNNLGHSSTRITTDIYTHTTLTMRNECARIMQRVIV